MTFDFAPFYGTLAPLRGELLVQKAQTLIGALLLAGSLMFGQAQAQEEGQSELPASGPDNLELSIGDSLPDVMLENILSGRAKVNLSPVISDGFSVSSDARKKYWLRMKVSLPSEGGERMLSFERQNVRSIKLYLVEKSDKKVSVIPFQSSQSPHQETTRGSWPTRIVFVLPAAVKNESVLYAELELAGYVHLSPRLLTVEQQATLSASDDAFFTYLYFAILILICLAIYRQLRAAESQAILVGLGLIVGLFGFFAYNTHLPLFLKTEFINRPSLAYAMLIFATAPFLTASSIFSGLNARWQGGAVWVVRFALLLMGLAVFVALTDYLDIGFLQLMTSILWTAVIGMAGFICLFDVRSSRWSALIVSVALLAAVWAPTFVYEQMLPATRMNRYGFEVFFIILMLVYLVFPWLRLVLQERGRRRRVVPAPELTPEEKIAIARKQLMEGLQSALVNANENDVEWIAYRRLLEGLKPILPQIASAVVAKNYHNEDLLLVEPKSATDRYAALISQRSNLLKNLSRMTAPQQISIDFDGPDGPLQEVSLAVIPLPIDKPGWGALIVEREADRTYTELEMDCGAEFAALATTAGDEAAEAMLDRHKREMDSETGLFNREKFDVVIKQLIDASILQKKQLSLLRICFDNFENLTANKPQLKKESLQSLVEALNDEVDYGVTLARFDAETIVVLMPDKNLGQARELAQRICNIAPEVAVLSDPSIKFTLSVGVSQLQSGERSSKLMFDRSLAALDKAQQYGGNQIQAVSS